MRAGTADLQRRGVAFGSIGTLAVIPGRFGPPRYAARPGSFESIDCAVHAEDGRVVQSQRQLELCRRRVRPLFPRTSCADGASPFPGLRGLASGLAIHLTRSISL